MNLFGTELFSNIRQRLGWLSERQTLLAENVANANTSNYKPKDLAPLSFDGMVKAAFQVVPATTQQGHITTARRSDDPAIQQVTDYKPSDVKLNGNAVSIEDQMMKVSETAVDYQGMIGLLRRWQQMLRIVTTRT